MNMTNRNKGIASVSFDFEPQVNAALDARLVVSNKELLTDPSSYDENAYIGMVVSVTLEKSLYMLTATSPTTLSNWKRIDLLDENGKILPEYWPNGIMPDLENINVVKSNTDPNELIFYNANDSLLNPDESRIYVVIKSDPINKDSEISDIALIGKIYRYNPALKSYIDMSDSLTLGYGKDLAFPGNEGKEILEQLTWQ